MTESLLIKSYDRDGRPLDLDTIYLTDLAGRPIWSERRRVGPGEIQLGGPKTEPFNVCCLWEASGFGKCLLTADNEGDGYRLGGEPIVLNQELARSRRRTLEERKAQLRADGYTVPTALGWAIEDVERRFHAGTGHRIDLVPDLAARALDDALSAMLWVEEQIVLVRAKQNIAQMSDERRKKLLVGCNAFAYQSSERYRERFAEVFNFATVPFYRARLEPVEGQIDWKTRDDMLDWLESRQITPKGHPLFWAHDAGLPDWMRKLSYPTLRDLVHRQLVEAVGRYKDRIKIWDVINEASGWPPGNLLEWDREQLLEMTAIAAQAVREADHEAIRIVNVHRPWSEYTDRFESEDLMDCYQYFALLAERGVEYEVVGLQMYHGAGDAYCRDLATQWDLLDQYARLGKPIHITELGTPSATGRDVLSYMGSRREVLTAGWWHKPWDLETQAEWVEGFYTMALGHPAVEAITWWDLADPAFWPHGGYLDASHRPKPSFHRLKDLVDLVRGTRPPAESTW